MTISEFAEKSGLKIVSLSNPDIEVTGAYCGDLLSWVMGRAMQGNIWLTIMSNLNVAAVSVMADVSCVILCEDVKPDDNLYHKALIEDVNILLSMQPIYETAILVNKILTE